MVSFTALYATPESKKHIFDFLVGRYIENHDWSPPVAKEHPDWANMLDEINPELSFALTDTESVVAASSTLEGNQDVLDVCWSYASSEHGQENATALVTFLLAHHFRKAVKAGLTQANVEIDSSHSDKQGLLEWLPIKKHQVWKLFQKAF